MRIAKPVLLVTTPIGLAMGVYEGFQLTGGLAFIILAQILLFGAACLVLVRIVRREQRTGTAVPEEAAGAVPVAESSRTS